MLSQQEIYSFEDRDGVESSFITYSISEAREFAARNRLRLIAHMYEWIDSELIEDYTGNAEDYQP